MRYSPSLEEKYQKSYKPSWENLEMAAYDNVAEDIVKIFDIQQSTQIFNLTATIDHAGFLELLNDCDEDAWQQEFRIDKNATRLYFNINSGISYEYRFAELQNNIKFIKQCKDGPLPSGFFLAIKNKAFIIHNEGAEIPYAGLEGLTLKNYSDLPPDFIEGVNAGTITIDSSQDKELKSEILAGHVALACQAFKSRPLVLLVHGSHHGHVASYIARISEENDCEFLSFNSLPDPDGYDEFTIGFLKKGIQKGLGLTDDKFADPRYTMLHQEDVFFCTYVTGAVLSQVKPEESLADQYDFLRSVMDGVITNKLMFRRLCARMQWWVDANTIRYEPENKKDPLPKWVKVVYGSPELKPSMQIIFKQLLYFVSKIEAPEKIDYPSDSKAFKEGAKFLNIFNIKINDPNFLKLFNPVDKYTEEQIKGMYKDYFDENAWSINRNEILQKLFAPEEPQNVTQDLIVHALDDLAKHARDHLKSSVNTNRAHAGQQKYDALISLLDNAKNFDELMENVEKLLDVEDPNKSPLLKNRGGFFGAYKTLSRIANSLGKEHYAYRQRTAISRTDHYLIALYDALNAAKKSKGDDGYSNDESHSNQ